ncbi:MAG TPA: fructosamine kinase family protein [Chromatiales bacterium]|nr:fructosamine kinase family protein [Chromatiales bacterium]
MNWQDIATAIERATGRAPGELRVASRGGGCINEAWLLDDGERRFFVKANTASSLEMFEAEAEGLHELRKADAIRVPEPIATGVSGRNAWLVMEALPLGASPDPTRFGEQLARMHEYHAPHYGWHRDNTIGSTPQPNGWMDDWVAFLRERRLGFQLELARSRGLDPRTVAVGERLLESLPAFFDSPPAASLLHGDLWRGNVGGLPDGSPAIFDPAVYYGDAEADLAMTELFGGFGEPFFAAYRAVRPISPDYPTRRTLYNLYHILNHYNLFGGGYDSQADNMIRQLLAEAGA